MTRLQQRYNEVVRPALVKAVEQIEIVDVPAELVGGPSAEPSK